MLIVVGAGTNLTAAGMRAFVGIVAILLALVQVGALVLAHSTEPPPHASVWFQSVATLLAVVLASYLYCFRFRSWERDVAEVKEKEDKEVEDLGMAAERKSMDEGGTRL